MARETRPRSGRASKYGMCVNEECEKYKEVQEITHGDFVCEKCGKPLTSCPPPIKNGKKGKTIAIIAVAIALLAIIGGIIAFSGGSTEEQQALAPTDSIAAKDSVEVAPEVVKDTVVVTDTIVQRDTVKVETPAKVKESKPASVKPAASGSKNLGYATFKGSWPNDVNGRMVFKTSHVIDSRDPKGRVAEAGDYVMGEWADGHLVQGIWYGADNQVKGSILIGR